MQDIEGATPEQITTQPAGVGTWRWAPDSKRIYFVTANSTDADEKLRREKKFTVNIRNAETPLAILWALDLDPAEATRLTVEAPYSVTDFTIADDSKWLAFRGSPADRYKRNITQEGLYADLYLLEAATGMWRKLPGNHPAVYQEPGSPKLDHSPLTTPVPAALPSREGF